MAIVILRWTARVLALGLFLLWGAFFVAHLEWFTQPSKGLPPPWVWAAQLMHLTMLVGLLLLWRWPLWGGLVAIVGAAAFFLPLAWESRSPTSLLVFFGVTILPALLALIGYALQQPCQRRAPTS
jgi:hypothetical protein